MSVLLSRSPATSSPVTGPFRSLPVTRPPSGGETAGGKSPPQQRQPSPPQPNGWAFSLLVFADGTRSFMTHWAISGTEWPSHQVGLGARPPKLCEVGAVTRSLHSADIKTQLTEQSWPCMMHAPRDAPFMLSCSKNREHCFQEHRGFHQPHPGRAGVIGRQPEASPCLPSPCPRPRQGSPCSRQRGLLFLADRKLVPGPALPLGAEC